jgi:hypothetical protein
MKLKKLGVLTIFALASVSCFGQAIQKCDVTVLRMISMDIGKLNEDEIGDFLLTFGKECRSNVEYSEWSNELLFSLLDKQTELTLRTIEKERNRIEIEEILGELSSPVHDGIEIKELITRVEKLKIDEMLKKKVMERLKAAHESMN